MTIGPAPICEGCTRRATADNNHLDGDGYTCEAFPKGIPEDIVLNQFDHRKPHAGDHELQFDPVNAEAARYARDLFK
jgi:hypothetical protein